MNTIFLKKKKVVLLDSNLVKITACSVWITHIFYNRKINPNYIDIYHQWVPKLENCISKSLLYVSGLPISPLHLYLGRPSMEPNLSGQHGTSVWFNGETKQKGERRKDLWRVGLWLWPGGICTGACSVAWDGSKGRRAWRGRKEMELMLAIIFWWLRWGNEQIERAVNSRGRRTKEDELFGMVP